MKIKEEGSNNWICTCGNTPDSQGFFPCNSNGDYVEPTPEEWKTDSYVCDRCGNIIDMNTLEVVGVKS